MSVVCTGQWMSDFGYHSILWCSPPPLALGREKAEARRQVGTNVREGRVYLELVLPRLCGWCRVEKIDCEDWWMRVSGVAIGHSLLGNS